MNRLLACFFLSLGLLVAAGIVWTLFHPSLEKLLGLVQACATLSVLCFLLWYRTRPHRRVWVQVLVVGLGAGIATAFLVLHFLTGY